MLKKVLARVKTWILDLRQIRVISRLLCFCGLHRMRIGFGWSEIKRYDTCFDCRYSIWVEDIEGRKKIDKELRKHVNNKLT